MAEVGDSCITHKLRLDMWVELIWEDNAKYSEFQRLGVRSLMQIRCAVVNNMCAIHDGYDLSGSKDAFRVL